MKKQELETKLEQIQIKRNAIFDDIESLRSNEADADKEIAGIKAEIKAVDKPELRHGDYGLSCDCGRVNSPFIYIDQNQNPDKVYYEDDRYHSNARDICKPLITIGNIFDDLAAIREPLESFKIKAPGGCEIKGNVDSNDWFDLFYSGKTSGWDAKGLSDYITLLRRALATLKSK